MEDFKTTQEEAGKPSEKELPPKKGRGRYIKSAISTIAAGAALLASEGEHHDHSSTKDNITHWFVNDQENLRQKIENKLGYDLVELAQANNFKTDLWFEAPAGRPYLVVVGQTHYVDGVTDEGTVEKIVTSQKNIESFVKHIAGKEHSKKKIYCEGIISSINQDFTIRVRDALKNLEPGDRVFEQLVNKFDDVFSKNYSDRKTMNAFASYQFKNRINEIGLYYRSHADQFIPTEHYADIDEALIWSLKNTKSELIEKFGEDAFYLDGAESKLADDGIVEISASETREAKSLMDGLHKSDHSKVFRANEFREDVTVNMVAGDNLGDDKTRIIIYGSSHLFMNNVKKYNSIHPDMAVGLITLTSEDK